MGPNPAFRQVVLLNSKYQKSVIISRLSRESSGELNDHFSSDLLVKTSQGKRYISPVYVDNITSEPMVVISVPVNDVFGDFRGILIAEVNLKFMWDLVESIKIGRTGLAYVVDKDGRLIAFGDISRVLRGENVGKLKTVHEFISSLTSITESKPNVFQGINGATVLGTYLPLNMPDWAVVIELPVAEAYGSVIRNVVGNIVFIVIVALMAGFIGVYLAQRLAFPLVNLMKTANRITNGEMDLQVEVVGPAEIASLAKAFNIMTAKLREVINSLEQRSQYLQKTVQKYVEYMARVGQGDLVARLDVDEQTENQNDPLILLGRQLNDTTANLQRMINQINETTFKLKKHEERLQLYSDRLKKSNIELEQFAYTASHDLQEPLRKIQFFGERLKTNYSSLLDEKAREYIERINNAGIRMSNFIRDLLQYSRVTTKARPFETVDLNQIIKEVLSDLEIIINETKAEIKCEIIPAIDADPLQMKQLFQNIIGNAIKYHRPNVFPLIIIDYKIHDGEIGNFLAIIIQDNGIGFEEKYSEQIFGLFQRLHGRNEYAGTGIGLAICKKIVEKHGGTISAHGKENEGATFYINLPLKQNKQLFY